MPALDCRIMPARSISRCEAICASLGFSRISGRKYWERRIAPRPRHWRRQSRQAARPCPWTLSAGPTCRQDRPMLDRFFRLEANGTTLRTEIVAGVTTFLAMAYIVLVNPQILGAAGMDQGAVFVAT